MPGSDISVQGLQYPNTRHRTTLTPQGYNMKEGLKYFIKLGYLYLLQGLQCSSTELWTMTPSVSLSGWVLTGVWGWCIGPVSAPPSLGTALPTSPVTRGDTPTACHVSWTTTLARSFPQSRTALQLQRSEHLSKRTKSPHMPIKHKPEKWSMNKDQSTSMFILLWHYDRNLNNVTMYSDIYVYLILFERISELNWHFLILIKEIDGFFSLFLIRTKECIRN